MIMTPWEDLFFVINNLLLGEEPVSKEISLTSRHRRMPVSEMIFSEPTCRFDGKRKNKYIHFFLLNKTLRHVVKKDMYILWVFNTKV